MKNKIIKKISLLAFSAIVLLSAGCGSGASKKEDVVLTIWKPFVASDKIQPIISDFTSRYPNVRIEYVQKNIETYESDLINALASGTGPDIYAINNTWVPKYTDKITPAPEGTYSIKEYKETFVDALASNLVIDNKIYGTALWVDSLALFYNKDILGSVGIATPPKTWEDLASDSQSMTIQDDYGYFARSGVAMGGYTNVNRGTDILYLLMLQAGVTPWTSDGRSPTFASTSTSIKDKKEASKSPGEQALQYYTSFANPLSGNYTWNQDSDYSIDAFANGRTGFLYGYSYTKDQIEAKAPNLNYGTSIVPQFNLADPAVNYSTYFAEVVSKQGKHSDWAWKFLKFATSKDSLSKYYKTDLQPSSRRDLIEQQTSDEKIGVFAYANLTGKTFYKVDEVKFDSIIGEMIENVILKGQDTQQALSRAQSLAGTLVK
jgi:multiple sugar transport system substrate-binding protein